ncbi:hypothetical protein UMM65_12480 [Aureibaculum sp. 2210JD6-5]|nr:hypothetical protein [Aureibaculum sp. 2210JD6-5]MDY7396061.1 hypothetical protein [Aureibaculum sp. 2210JD6-5]
MNKKLKLSIEQIEIFNIVKELKGSVKLPKSNKTDKELIEDALIEKHIR